MLVVWSPLALRRLDTIFDDLAALDTRPALDVSAALNVRYRSVRGLVRIVRVRHASRNSTTP